LFTPRPSAATAAASEHPLLTCGLPCSPNGVRTHVSTLRGSLECPGQGTGIESDLRKQSRQVPVVSGHFCVLLGPLLARPSAGWRRSMRMQRERFRGSGSLSSLKSVKMRSSLAGTKRRRPRRDQVEDGRTKPRHPTRDRVNPRTLFFRPLQAPTLASVVDLVRSIELLGSVWPPHQCGTATETAAASSGAKMKIPDSNRSSRP